MSVGAPTTMTMEEMLALPENGTDRELIRGQLREKPATPKDRWHSSTAARISYWLSLWAGERRHDTGWIVGGVGFCLHRNPDTAVGIDIAYVSAEVVKHTPKTQPYFEGPPVLAVEILSPSDSHEDVSEKINLCKEAGVALVWIVNPDLQTVLVLRAGEEPELFNVRQELPGGPELPGFRVPVAEIFPF